MEDDGHSFELQASPNETDDLAHLFSAYFYEAWNEYEYASWKDAVDDFIVRSPERVAGAANQLCDLLASSVGHDAVGARLQDLGCAFSPDDHRVWLRAVLDRLREQTRTGPAGLTASQDLVRRLVADFPSLAHVMEEHLADEEGELLPYIFMADVARWANATYVERPDEVGVVLDWLEREFHDAAEPEKDLIALGFVEAIPFPPEGAAVLLRLGSRLTQVARELGLLPGRPHPFP